MSAARDLIASTFGPDRSLPPEELPGKLEQTLALGRNSWPLPTIRQLADWMLEFSEGRARAAALEARWLNLCSFCLRPGFGYPGDDFRIDQARRIYASGLRFPNSVEWKFNGGSCGAALRVASIVISKPTSFSGSPRRSCRSKARKLHESTRAFSVRCGAPPQVWSCFRTNKNGFG